MPRRQDKTEPTRITPPPGEDGARVAFLQVLSGPQLGQVRLLRPHHKQVLGRDGGADITIDDEGVSRRHCSIEIGNDNAWLTDLGSTNGTFVDGRRICERLIADGQSFQIGSTRLKFGLGDAEEVEVRLRLSEAAVREPLTGLYNRRFLEERLTAEYASAMRHARGLALLLLDVDHFKRINDAHGHLAGDEVLRMVASRLQGAVRIEDIVARYGGDEFVVIAREADLSGAQHLAERLRKLIESGRCTVDGVELSVTVSVGVTLSIGTGAHAAPGSERELMEAADRALYAAKKKGRNCAVAIPAGDPPTPVQHAGRRTRPGVGSRRKPR